MNAKPLFVAWLLVAAGFFDRAVAFDPAKASDWRFKVEYVEPKTLPSLEKLPAYYSLRVMALRNEQE